MCSLDLVNAAAYLAFLDPEDAKNIRFEGEYFFARRKLAQIKEDEEELVSQFTESDLADFADEKDLLGFKTPKN